MHNFENVSKAYRERVRWLADDWIGTAIQERIKTGATFDAKAVMKIFTDSVDYARMITDLEVSSGLCPLVEEKHCEKCDIGEGDSEGPTSGGGNEVGVRDPIAPAKSPSNNGSTSGGEVNSPEQQPVPPQSGPGEGRRHSSVPQSPTVHTSSEDGRSGTRPGVSDLCG